MEYYGIYFNLVLQEKLRFICPSSTVLFITHQFFYSNKLIAIYII